MRNAISYDLLNWRRHGEDRAAFARTWRVDPFSSGPLFFHRQELEDSPVLWPLRPTYQPLLVLRPRTWLLAKGWRQFHLLSSLSDLPLRGPRPRLSRFQLRDELPSWPASLEMFEWPHRPRAARVAAVSSTP